METQYCSIIFDHLIQTAYESPWIFEQANQKPNINQFRLSSRHIMKYRSAYVLFDFDSFIFIPASDPEFNVTNSAPIRASQPRLSRLAASLCLFPIKKPKKKLTAENGFKKRVFVLAAYLVGCAEFSRHHREFYSARRRRRKRHKFDLWLRSKISLYMYKIMHTIIYFFYLYFYVHVPHYFFFYLIT
jgi:hypothetical protein